MTFSEGDRVHIHFKPELVGTVTADQEPMFGRMVGVRWDSSDFAFVNPVKLAFAGTSAMPCMSEADMSALADAHRRGVEAVMSLTRQNRTESGTDVTSKPSPNGKELTDWQTRAERAEGKVFDALALHYPITEDGEPIGCASCDWEHEGNGQWPCPTRAVLLGAES